MENNFDGGELYYQKRREVQPTQTKYDSLYGIFEDSNEYSRKKLKKDGYFSKKKDLDIRMNFVVTRTFLKEQDASDDKPGLGLALNFVCGCFDKKDGSNENGNDDYKFLPTESGKRIKEEVIRRGEERLQKKRKNHGFNFLGQEGSLDVGKFESHTKGIGMKMLEKMGYKGGGLGKNEQGILIPIEAKLRAKNSGLGFNESKDSTTLLPALLTEKSAPGGGVCVQPMDRRKRECLWLRQLRNMKKEDEKYVTAEELLARKQEEDSEVAQKIYDMRGPQVLMYTNLFGLIAEEKAKEKDVPMPELQHNASLIVLLAEADIQVIDRDFMKERNITLSLKKKKRSWQRMQHFKRSNWIINYEKIMNVLDRVGEANTLGTLTIDSFVSHCLLICYTFVYESVPRMGSSSKSISWFGLGITVEDIASRG